MDEKKKKRKEKRIEFSIPKEYEKIFIELEEKREKAKTFIDHKTITEEEYMTWKDYELEHYVKIEKPYDLLTRRRYIFIFYGFRPLVARVDETFLSSFRAKKSLDTTKKNDSIIDEYTKYTSRYDSEDKKWIPDDGEESKKVKKENDKVIKIYKFAKKKQCTFQLYQLSLVLDIIRNRKNWQADVKDFMGIKEPNMDLRSIFDIEYESPSPMMLGSQESIQSPVKVNPKRDKEQVEEEEPQDFHDDEVIVEYCEDDNDGGVKYSDKFKTKFKRNSQEKSRGCSEESPKKFRRKRHEESTNSRQRQRHNHRHTNSVNKSRERTSSSSRSSSPKLSANTKSSRLIMSQNLECPPAYSDIIEACEKLKASNEILLQFTQPNDLFDLEAIKTKELKEINHSVSILQQTLWNEEFLKTCQIAYTVTNELTNFGKSLKNKAFHKKELEAQERFDGGKKQEEFSFGVKK